MPGPGEMTRWQGQLGGIPPPPGLPFPASVE
jgi:hypothetical protein